MLGGPDDVFFSTDTRVELRHDVFAPSEERVVAGFLAGYGGLTRDAYMHHALRPSSGIARRHATYIVATFIAGAAR